ncbi:MAG TPA: ABC transporter substrate-binding protein [Nakamurella sp.]
MTSIAPGPSSAPPARSWNPSGTGSGNDTLYVSRQLFDSFTQQDPHTGELGPWLAESYTAAADTTSFTFTLREGVTFSDGTSLTAASVKATFDDVVANGADALGAIPYSPATSPPRSPTIGLSPSRSARRRARSESVGQPDKQVELEGRPGEGGQGAGVDGVGRRRCNRRRRRRG